jgi:hypothetical protein
MANGPSTNIPIPGFSAGFQVSNTAILVAGGLALILTAVGCMHIFRQKGKIEMNPEVALQKIHEDVYAYAASPSQARANADRIHTELDRLRPMVRAASDTYKAAIRAITIKLRAKQITHDQAVAQIHTARNQYLTAIRLAWQQIHDSIGLATFNPHLTLPNNV